MFFAFQSTLPAGGATCRFSHTYETFPNFNPRSPQGERHYFQVVFCATSKYLNPRSPQGERLTSFRTRGCGLRISIHAPRRGSDIQTQHGNYPMHIISIHAPRRGSDYTSSSKVVYFLNFNPRSPQGERRSGKSDIDCSQRFQSTLPAGGATYSPPAGSLAAGQFQSTLPAGGATFCEAFRAIVERISIHAPRRGSDLYILKSKNRMPNFNPRSPQGERPDKHA